MIHAIAIIAVLAASPALAVGPIDLPPPQYDHPFAGNLTVEVIDWRDVPARCGLRWVNACAMRYLSIGLNGHLDWNSCTIIYPRLNQYGINADDFVKLIRHETGHCNGWPNDHPDARF